MSTFTTSNGSRALLVEGTTMVQYRRMSDRYQVVDPTEIAYELRRADYSVREVKNLGWSRGWTQALEVESFNRRVLAPAYHTRFRMLLDHTGRHSLMIVPGALRVECENQFHSRDAAWRCRHDDIERVQEFLRDPVTVFRDLEHAAEQTLHRLSHMHGIPMHDDWGLILDRAKPRLGKAIRRAWTEDYGGDRDMWGLCQALTAVKRPGAQEMADLVLGEGYGQASTGAVPDALMAELARADVRHLN